MRWNDREGEQGGDQQSERPTRLQHADGDAATLGRPHFGNQGHCGRPQTAETEADKTAIDAQFGDRIGRAAQEIEQAVEEDRQQHRRLAPDLVADAGDHDAADGGRGQKDRHHAEGLAHRDVEVLDDRRDRVGVDGGVHGVEQPRHEQAHQQRTTKFERGQEGRKYIAQLGVAAWFCIRGIQFLHSLGRHC